MDDHGRLEEPLLLSSKGRSTAATQQDTFWSCAINLSKVWTSSKAYFHSHLHVYVLEHAQGASSGGTQLDPPWSACQGRSPCPALM